jgi:U3 small nucleolar RNA-associated protein 18
MLNPVPDWAIEAAQKGSRKKRRLSYDDLDAESDMDLDMEDEEGDDEISAEPLSKLLQGGGLVRRTETKKRKLRPEVIDIQRTKDIGSTQPSAITSLQYHPELPLLLSSGPSSTLYLHHIVASPPAPEANPLLTSLHIRKTPLTTTAFHPTTLASSSPPAAATSTSGTSKPAKWRRSPVSTATNTNNAVWSASSYLPTAAAWLSSAALAKAAV